MPQDMTTVKQDNPVAEDRGKIEIVHRGDHADSTSARFSGKTIHDMELMPEVQVRIWFVKQQHNRFLGQGPGKDSTLLFAARELRDRPLTELVKVHQRHGPIGGNKIIRALESSDSMPMRNASQKHGLGNSELESGRVRLWHECKSPRAPHGGDRLDRSSLKKDPPAVGLCQPRQNSHGCRLARTVPADDANKLAGLYLEHVDPQGEFRGVVESYIFSAEEHVGIAMPLAMTRGSSYTSRTNGNSGVSMTTRLIASVDIGGTKLAVGLARHDAFVRNGRFDQVFKEPIPYEGQPEAVIDRVVSLARHGASEQQGVIASIGISIGGPLDPGSGLVINFPHLPGWRSIPLRSLLSQLLDAPAVLDNDANLGALAEHALGAGQGSSDMIYMTISSGIGGGVIVGGDLHHGAASGAGEVGHITVAPDGDLCPCGNRGCLEVMASGRSIARRARARVAADPQGGKLLLDAADGIPQNITSELVARLWGEKEPLAWSIWEETAEYLAIGIANVIHVLAPEVVVLGGGVAGAGMSLLKPVKRRLRNHVFYIPLGKIRLVLAELGHDSALIGAGVIAARRMVEA